ncbi:NlpC/P60 family protein [Clostridium paraputrificum]|uniref:C40 family peptidase n=1 Tax=Clostridium TaxID=1485 RepID=UPI003D34B88D
MKNKILAAIIAGVIVLSTVMPAMPVSATPASQELQEVQNKQKELEKKLAELREKVQVLDNQISPLAEKINKNNNEISNINKEIDNTKKEIEQSKVDISEKEQVLGERLRELYKSGGQTSYISLIFSADSFSDLISKVDSASRLVKLDKKVVQELVEKKDKLDEKIGSLEDKSKEIAKINEDTEKQKEELDVKKAEIQPVLNEANAAAEEYARENLIPMERSMVKSQVDICMDSNSSLDQLKSAVSQLRAIRSANQIKSPVVDKEVVDAIENAKKLIKQKEDQASAPNRGDGVTANATQAAILDEAYRHLGKPYLWAGKGPNSFDCSGFTSYVYRRVTGIEIGGSTYSQINAGREVSQSELQPGDLVFPHSGHVGIYVGNGQMIHAPQTGDVVKVSSVYKFWRARRILN